MQQHKFIAWVVVVLFAAACGATPTPTPTALPTAQPADTQPAATLPALTATAPANPAPSATVAEAVASVTPAATATAGNITSDTVKTVAAGEVVKLAGDSFTTSDSYRFNADTTLDITWNYTGTAPFALWLVNVSEVVTDPNYDRILINDVTGPHAGSAQTKIIAGDWTVQVEQGEGPWTVEVKPES
jgi:hypothetical protein